MELGTQKFDPNLTIIQCYNHRIKWGFLQWGYPHIIHVNGSFQNKPAIWRYPHGYGTSKWRSWNHRNCPKAAGRLALKVQTTSDILPWFSFATDLPPEGLRQKSISISIHPSIHVILSKAATVVIAILVVVVLQLHIGEPKRKILYPDSLQSHSIPNVHG